MAGKQQIKILTSPSTVWGPAEHHCCRENSDAHSSIVSQWNHWYLQALKQCGVEAGRNHIWDFHPSRANQKAVANAGPPEMPNKEAKKKGKSPAADEDEKEEDDGRAAATEEQSAGEHLMWWEFGKGPQVPDRLTHHPSGNSEAWMESGTSEDEILSEDGSGQPHLLIACMRLPTVVTAPYVCAC